MIEKHITVVVERDAVFNFPDAIYSADHFAAVQAYSEAGRDITTHAQLHLAIAEYWALNGYGYCEPYGVNICQIESDKHLFGMADAPTVTVRRDELEATESREEDHVE